MARPLRVEYPGAFYHVSSRGNEGKSIFLSDRDKKKFLSYLEVACKRFKIIIHAYCIMLNHYHLLLTTSLANLSKCMQFINSSYTTYFNIKRKRTGHLFQGRYKGILVDKDSYMQELSRYIHLNPVRKGIVKLPEEYPWSTYKYYIGQEKTPDFLDTEFTLKYFGGSREEYKKFVEMGIAGKIKNPFEDVKAGFILGDSGFVGKVKGKYLKNIKELEDVVGIGQVRKEYFSSETIIDIIKYKEDLRGRQCDDLIVYLLRKHTGETLKEISNRVFNGRVSSQAIHQIVVRLENRRQKDKQLDKTIKDVKQQIEGSDLNFKLTKKI